MTTARAALRKAVLGALQTIGFDRASPGEWDVQPSTMPACRVRAAADIKRGLSKAPPIFDTTVGVEVQLYVVMPTQEAAQDSAEDFSDEIEEYLLSDPTLVSLVSAFSSVSSQVFISTAGGKPIAKVDMTLELLTREQFTARPPFAALQLLSMAVDFAGGPVDPSGVYTDPPIGDAPTAPPRAAADGGPDGRVEGAILLDMTTGLPPPSIRPRVLGMQVTFPDGRTLDQMRGWNWGRFGQAKESDADLAQQQGATMIRIPLRWWGLYDTQLISGESVDSRDASSPSTAFINPEHLAIFDQQVQWCITRKLWFTIFIDSDCGQNGLQPGEPDYCTVGAGGAIAWPNGRNFFTDPTQLAIYRNVWRFIARKYAQAPYWALAEITPEISWQGSTDQDLVNYYGLLSSDIRQCAPGVPFLVGGPGYKLPQVGSAFDKSALDYVYTGDLFVRPSASPDPVTDLNTRLQSLLNLRANKGVPIFLQQMGVKSGDDISGNVYLRALLNASLSNAVGGTYWQLRDGNTSTEYGVIWTDNAGVEHVKTDEMALIAQWIAGQAV